MERLFARGQRVARSLLLPSLLLAASHAFGEDTPATNAEDPTDNSAIPAPAPTPSAPPPKAIPAPTDFVDLDGNQSPAPVKHTFKSDSLVNGKVGFGAFAIGTEPTGVRSGYTTLFSEGDWLGAFGTGLGVHWDLDLRVGLGLFEQRDPTAFNRLEVDDTVTGPASYADPTRFYDHAKTFATGRTTDYLRIDKLYLSYDIESIGVDFGRVRINEASSQIIDGVQARVDVGGQRFGLFAGLRPNPWHQQVVGAASGGFVPVDLGLGGLNEFIPVAWGGTTVRPELGFTEQTYGPYSNELAGGYAWSQVASYRFQSVGLWTSLRFDPGFVDVALVGDFFFDPTYGVNPGTGALTTTSDGFGIDRVWLFTTGGLRFLENATVAWRGTLDVIGARALMPRDLFLDFTWRDLGPLTFSVSYFKVNTYATSYAYARFFQPLEQPWSLDPDDAALAPYRGFANVNNDELYVVDRDRLRARASLFVGDALQLYFDTLAERRADFAYKPTIDIGGSFAAFGDGLANVGQTAPEMFSCGSPAAEPAPAGAPVGTNATVPVWADRCKLGGSIGIRDPFLAGLGAFDVRASQMLGYFSSTTRLSGQLGVAVADRVWLDVMGGIERNNYHRIFQPLRPSTTAGGFAAYGFLPATTNLADFSAGLSWNVWDGIFVDGTYYAFAEQIPFQGDSSFLDAPSRLDPVQLTQMLFARAMYRF